MHNEVKHQPGFVSANLHKSQDGKKVANYAQWKSQRDLDNFRSNPDIQKQATFLGKFQPDSRSYDIFDYAVEAAAVLALEPGNRGALRLKQQLGQ